MKIFLAFFLIIIGTSSANAISPSSIQLLDSDSNLRVYEEIGKEYRSNVKIFVVKSSANPAYLSFNNYVMNWKYILNRIKFKNAWSSKIESELIDHYNILISNFHGLNGEEINLDKSDLSLRVRDVFLGYLLVVEYWKKHSLGSLDTLDGLIENVFENMFYTLRANHGLDKELSRSSWLLYWSWRNKYPIDDVFSLRNELGLYSMTLNSKSEQQLVKDFSKGLLLFCLDNCGQSRQRTSISRDTEARKNLLLSLYSIFKGEKNSEDRNFVLKTVLNSNVLPSKEENDLEKQLIKDHLVSNPDLKVSEKIHAYIRMFQLTTTIHLKIGLFFAFIYLSFIYSRIREHKWEKWGHEFLATVQDLITQHDSIGGWMKMTNILFVSFLSFVMGSMDFTIYRRN